MNAKGVILMVLFADTFIKLKLLQLMVFPIIIVVIGLNHALPWLKQTLVSLRLLTGG